LSDYSNIFNIFKGSEIAAWKRQLGNLKSKGYPGFVATGKGIGK
jgi:hypothetical protein